jgi:hypothetical protein
MQPIDEYTVEPEEYYAMQETDEEPIQEDGMNWLSVAKDAYNKSDDFFSSSLRKQIEKNIDLFNSRHPSGSKYHQDSYKYRSKIFRPKTRSSIRRHEAAAATAYFSTQDVVKCKPANQSDEAAVFGAMVGENLVNARLGDPDFRWFQTCIGAYQDAMVQGAVVSRQIWKYKEKKSTPKIEVEIDGEDVEAEMVGYEEKPIIDRPDIVIIPLENFRFDPAADWRDPIESSPYLIELMPMYRADVKARMDKRDPKTDEPKWNKLSDEELSSSDSTGAMDSTRSTRTDGREDKTDINHANSDFDIIWVHRNIVRVDDEDWLYYTLGTTALLSEPVLLEEVSPIERDYVLGCCNIETHKTISAAPVELTLGLQQETNDIANQRLDNVKLVVNRRSFVRRGAVVDTRSLTQSVPGGVTLVDDIENDVRYDAPPDVTSSSYAEQDRLNMDFDELAGSFSNGSVATNRSLSETVGGMNLMKQDSNSVTEYQLRVFSETWLRPTLAQILGLEKYYESDEQLLSDAGNGIDPEVALEALQKDIRVSLAVGYGATDPQKQVERLAYGLGTVVKFLPHVVQQIDSQEIVSEIFGSLGWGDGKRFFNFEESEDPKVAQLMQVIQQLQGQLQGKQIESQTRLKIEQLKQRGMTEREDKKLALEREIATLKQQIEYIDQQIKAEVNDIKRGELEIQREAFIFSKQQKELDYATAERDKMSDVLMRDKYNMAPGS